MTRHYDRDYMAAHAEFAALDPEDYRVIPQSGVQQYIFPDSDRHNAIWDYYVTPDKRHLFSSCAEGDFAEGFILYEYFPETNTVKEIFKFDDTITNYPETLKASKIHTSLCAMEDGRIIFQSHTTAAAPSHPVWMPYAYRNHAWEGFPGSNVMIWDPVTNRVEDLGIPVRRESLYGGVYSPKCRAVFSSSLMNGHIYRFDLDDKKVTDYGNLTESSCCLLKIGTDGHVYFASSAGDFMRINTDTLGYEDLGLRFTVDTRYKDQNDMQMMYAVNGPDGKMYIGPRHCELLHVYDPAAQTMEVIGSVMPEKLAHYPFYGMIYGMDFDEDGVLWYGMITHPQPGKGFRGREHCFYLCSWDFLRGGRPVCYGAMGTERRRALVFSEAHITDGLFIGADTNHLFDPISIFCVDLKKLKADHEAGAVGPLPKDPAVYIRFLNGPDVYPGDLGRDAAMLYERMEAEEERTGKYKIMAEEWRFCDYSAGYVFKPWRDAGYENAPVRALYAGKDGTCTAICGEDPHYIKYVLRDGEVLSREDGVQWEAPPVPECLKNVMLPSAAGRCWKANASAAVPWHDGRMLVGTEDGLLALAGEDSVYSLGSLGMNGPILALCVTADGRTAYGAAGAPEDMAITFRYDDKNGLVQLGMISGQDPRPGTGELFVLDHISAMAVSPDGSLLFIGSDDVKSSVVELHLNI